MLLALFHTSLAPVGGRNNKKTLHEEIHIPTPTAQFSANLQSLFHLLVPDQAMVNDISRQLDEGEMRTPRYAPFVLSQLTLGPWRDPLPAHDRVVEDWADRAKAIRSIRRLPFQAYLFYQLRFIISGHLCSAWGAFGGIPSQFKALAAMRNLSVVEYSGYAVAYDLLMRNHIAQSSHQRRVDIDSPSLFRRRMKS